MKNKYYEVVFEGHYKAIYGLLEGFLLGSNKKWLFYFSKNAGVKAETLSEIILEWVTLKTKMHHVIMEDKFYIAFEKAIKEKEYSDFVHTKYFKSSKMISNASFEFEAKTYGRKYGNEIKAILNNLPNEVELHNYNPVEKDSDEGKGVELYTPLHDYIYEATGRLSGDIVELIKFREKLDEHQLIEVDEIILKF